MPLEDPSRKADLSRLPPSAQAVHQVKRRCLTWEEAVKKTGFLWRLRKDGNQRFHERGGVL